MSQVNYPQTEQDFIDLLKDYNTAYREGLSLTPKGLSPVTDEMYDAITEDFREKFPDSSFFSVIEEEIVGNNFVYHSSPMLSTEKAYTKENLSKWFNRVEEASLTLGVQTKYKVMCKLDGFAGNFENGILATRGDGAKGNNITHILGLGVVKPDGHEGRGEIVVSKSYFEANLTNDFAHPRGVISSVISADEIKDITKKILADGAIHFVPYTSIPCHIGNSQDILDNLEKINDELRNNIDYLIDGFVIEAISDEIKQYMGYNNHHYKWQIAFKEKGEKATTKVIDIKLQVGRTGVITPVLSVEPTLVSGAVISNVTAHHMNNIRIQGIGPGSVIEIIRSGEVIPKIEKVISTAEYTIPTSCPCCDSILRWDSHFLICDNHDGCSDQVKQSLLHFFDTLDNNDGFGGKTVSKLVEAGFDTLTKIYDMKEEDFVSAGFGPGESANLVEALNNSMKNAIEDWRYLAAFGIEDLGKGDSRKLLKKFALSEIRNVTSETLLAIKGYGEITSVSIVSGIQEKINLVESMMNKFNLIKTEVVSVDSGSVFAGKKVVVTGTLSKYSRKDIEAFFMNKGAEIQKKVNKTTNLLVYGESAGSKLSDAQTLSEKGFLIEILTEAEFLHKYAEHI